MAKNFYAIKRGYDKNNNEEVTDIISSDWNIVKPLVIGYENARYKGFDTEKEAKTWLSVVDKTDAEKRAKKVLKEEKEKIGIKNSFNNVFEDGDLMLKLDEKEIKELKEKGWTKYRVFYNIVTSIDKQLSEIYGK